MQVRAIQAEIDRRYSSLKNAARDRHDRLEKMALYFQFERESDELHSWMNDKEAVVASSETGKDVEQVEMLLKTFNDFNKDLEVRPMHPLPAASSCSFFLSFFLTFFLLLLLPLLFLLFLFIYNFF